MLSTLFINVIKALLTIFSVIPYNLSADPCYNYTELDDPRRATKPTLSFPMCDGNVIWDGWYRLYLNGQNAQMPETCVKNDRCGTHFALWLRGGHPKPEDGVVTRDICGFEGAYCCYYESYPIRVKACTGGYYVYEFVKPIRCDMAYCADVSSVNFINTTINSTDPCNNYTVLNDSRRSTNYYSSSSMCDTSVNWVGWYRLYLNGQSTQMPETCVAVNRCGTNIPLWLSGGHPRIEDGVVTRDVCGHANNYCCNYQSYPIRVKGCTGGYYVYELVTPTYTCSAYCADDLSADPCYSYNVLDNAWRATNYHTTNPFMCDRDVSWVGWNRLFLNGQNIRMPETYVETSSCGTQLSLWLRGGHPKPEDGVVTRDVCGYFPLYIYSCSFQSYPIRVKACTGGYYVYEFVRPTTCNMAYCADVDSINKTYITVKPTITTPDIKSTVNTTINTVKPAITTPGINITQLTNCTDVNKLLDMVYTSVDPEKLASDVLNAMEKLVSVLVKPTNTYYNVSFTCAAVEAQVFIVGPHANLDKIPQLNTTNASLDIDLIGIARNNSGSAAVAFMSYNTMENLLKPDLFNTSDNTNKTMMSTVISATLPKTNNTTLTKPVNFTLKHIRELNERGNLSCVYWNISEWIVDGCSVVQTNSSHTVCSCLHLSTFALIMQTRASKDDDPLMKLVKVMFVILGLVFLILILLTIAVCRWRPVTRSSFVVYYFRDKMTQPRRSH